MGGSHQVWKFGLQELSGNERLNVNARIKIPMKSTWAPMRASRILRRQCACGGSGGDCGECKDKQLQRSAASSGPAMAPSIVHEVLRSSGQSLSAKARALFEPRFGHDFGKVRVHTDARASQSAQAVDALAYTVGPQIVFRNGQYQPDTRSGQRLLAHELTHVVQQGDQTFTARPLRVGPANDAYEQEADRTATVTASTAVPSSAGHASTSVQRQAADPSLGSSATTGQASGPGPAAAHSIPKPETCDAPKEKPTLHDLGCTPNKEKVTGAFRTVDFVVDRYALAGDATAKIHEAAEEWKKRGASGKIRVDGYASAQYQCEYNWRLSCHRAKAVGDELKKAGGKDILESQIDVFAHGESDEAGAALAANQRATITLPAGPGPKQPEPKPEPAKPEHPKKWCTPGPGKPSTDCGIYKANSWWLPLAYVHNATCACETTPDTPEYQCIRKTLQDRLAAAPWELTAGAALMKHLEGSPDVIDFLRYNAFVVRYITPMIYADHVAAYQACCCPGGPAPRSAWVGVTTFLVPSCSVIKWSILAAGTCYGIPGGW